jgi:haloacetate dehalogenase
MHRLYDVAATWRERAANVTGKSLPGTHYLVEEIPELVAAAFRGFFESTQRRAESRKSPA